MGELTLACDNRSIDGVTAARFLAWVKQALQGMQPGRKPEWMPE
jgi:pyruvate/2-oxoglutarate dehydrogenase complex dihydrolipoamide acyltransferase (E2) component